MLRDNLVELIEPMPNGAGADPLAPAIHKQREASDDRLSCLENPRPEGAESSLTENVTSPFQAEPAHLEVKGRAAGAEIVTVTKNEILYSLNKPEDFILAIVEFHPDGTHRAHYLRKPFQREPDFAVTSINYDMKELIAHAEAPR